MKNVSYILVTGGAGYIGSHTCIELLEKGFNIIVVDNLSNSSEESLIRVGKITGKDITFVKGDIRDAEFLDQIFSRYRIDSVIHFAGLKAVGESSLIPLEYYDVNVSGTITLCKVMEKHNVYNLVFSSSATVYGDSEDVPFSESQATRRATNPYGYSKLIVEEILQDLSKSSHKWSIALLRYFNPIGAHPSGLIGEDPNDIPNNLVPYVSQVAVGKLECLKIFGNDYPTTDGTGVRDYIHVVDLARGHLQAMGYIKEHTGCFIWNLGTGCGNSVLDVVNEYRIISKKDIPYQISPRRQGDIAVCYANADKAKKELNWEAKYSLREMLQDSWNWQSKNPQGYKG